MVKRAPRAPRRRQDGSGEPPREAPCTCGCSKVGTITDRITYRGEEFYFDYKVRTFCGEDLIEKAKAEQGDELAGVVKPKLPDDAASPYAPRTTCFWTIKFWRDGDEPQHDGVWIEHVLWRPDVRFPVATSIPETGAVEAIYPAAYGCKPATVFVLVGFGDRFGEHKFRYKKVDGCLPCPPTDD